MDDVLFLRWKELEKVLLHSVDDDSIESPVAIKMLQELLGEQGVTSMLTDIPLEVQSLGAVSKELVDDNLSLISASSADPKQDSNSLLPIALSLSKLLSSDNFRSTCHPFFFTWIALIAERISSDNRTSDFSNELLYSMLVFLVKRSDVLPPYPLLDTVLRIMHDVEVRKKFKESGWSSSVRVIVTRLLRTREVPWKLQQMCYLLAISTHRIAGPRFFVADDMFTRTLSKMLVINLRLQLEGLCVEGHFAPLMQLMEELHTIGEDEDHLSDECALALATDLRQATIHIVDHLRKRQSKPENEEDVTTEFLKDEERDRTMASFLSKELVAGAAYALPKEDTCTIAEWMQDCALTDGACLLSLLHCIDAFDKVDSRVLRACVSLVVREFPDGRWKEAEDIVSSSIEEMDRSDFYDLDCLLWAENQVKNIPCKELIKVLRELAH